MNTMTTKAKIYSAILTFLGVLIITTTGYFLGSLFGGIAYWGFYSCIVPFLLAILVVISLYKITGYKSIIDQRFGYKRATKAALVICINSSFEILMNRQTQEPWQGLFILPGGYFREDDRQLQETAIRRFNVITNVNVSWRVPLHIADLDVESVFVRGYLAQKKYKITQDSVFLLERSDQNLIDRDDIPISEDLSWFSREDIKKRDDIQFYMREIALFFLNREHNVKDLRLWNLTEEGKRYFNLI